MVVDVKKFTCVRKQISWILCLLIVYEDSTCSVSKAKILAFSKSSDHLCFRNEISLPRSLFSSFFSIRRWGIWSPFQCYSGWNIMFHNEKKATNQIFIMQVPNLKDIQCFCPPVFITSHQLLFPFPPPTHPLVLSKSFPMHEHTTGPSPGWGFKLECGW